MELMILMIRTFITSLVLLALSSNIYSKEEDSSLFARRIIEFWKDGDYSLAQGQAETFLKQYPESSYSESIKVILGNLFLKEKKYQRALDLYQEVKSEKLQESIFINTLYCLYITEKYEPLQYLIEKKFSNYSNSELIKTNPLFVFYRAETLFRIALLNNSLESDQLIQICLQVVPLYDSLLQGNYHINAQFSLAEVYAILGKGKQSSQIFLDLITFYPEKKEELTFKAAESIALSNLDKSSAMLLEIAKTSGKWSSKAASKWTALQYNKGAYQAVIDNYTDFYSSIEEETKDTLHLLVGACYYHLKMYKEVKEKLSFILKDSEISKSQKKEALLMLSGSAFELNDFLFMEHVSRVFFEEYPNDERLYQIVFCRGLLYKQNGNYKEAEKDFAYVIKNNPSFVQREELLFSLAVTFFKLEKWKDSREQFILYKKEYPNSSRWKEVTQYQIVSAQNLTRNGKSLKGQELLIDDLSILFDEEVDKIDSEERSKYLLLWASTLYYQKKYEKSLELLRAYLKSNPQYSNLDEIHLLMALCYNQIETMDKAFIFHAEKALFFNSELPESDQLRLILFNTYLRLNQKEKNLLQKEYNTEQAAAHLYEVSVFGKVPIEYKKNIWLSQHYFKQLKQRIDPFWENTITKEEDEKLAIKVVNLLKELCDFSGDKDSIIIDENTLYLEREIYRLAMVTALLKEEDLAFTILKNLEQEYENNPSYQWQWKEKTYFLLGKLYQQQLNNNLATEYYSKVTSSRKSSLYHYSQLKLARLEFSIMMSETADSLDENKFSAILKTLKNLQMRKYLPNEPIHLESALDYIDIKFYFDAEEGKLERQLYLLQRVKEEFTNQDDIQSKDYHARRELFPHKNAIYQAYIMLIDAKLTLLKSKIAFKKGRIHESDSYKEASKMIFQTLLEDKFSISSYLVEYVKKELKQLTINMM
jgi:TolA-binding protein